MKEWNDGALSAGVFVLNLRRDRRRDGRLPLALPDYSRDHLDSTFDHCAFVEIPAITYLGFWILTQIFSGPLSLGLPQDLGGVAS